MKKFAYSFPILENKIAQSFFSIWFRKEVSELQDIDLNYKTEMPEKVLDREE